MELYRRLRQHCRTTPFLSSQHACLQVSQCFFVSYPPSYCADSYRSWKNNRSSQNTGLRQDASRHRTASTVFRIPGRKPYIQRPLHPNAFRSQFRNSSSIQTRYQSGLSRFSFIPFFLFSVFPCPCCVKERSNFETVLRFIKAHGFDPIVDLNDPMGADFDRQQIGK